MNHDLRSGLSRVDLDLRRRAALGASAVLCVVLTALIFLPPKTGALEMAAHESSPPSRATQLHMWTIQDQASVDAEYLLQSWPDFGSTMTAMIAWPQQQAPQDVESIAVLDWDR